VTVADIFQAITPFTTISSRVALSH